MDGVLDPTDIIEPMEGIVGIICDIPELETEDGDIT